MRRTAILIAIGAGLIAAGILALRYFDSDSGAIWADPNDPALVARGAAVYREQCAACHGERLEGQPNWRKRRPDGRLPAPPHDETGHTWHHPDQQLFEVIKYGSAALAPPGYETDMGAYKDILPDRDILAVLAFIKSQWPPPIRTRQERLDAQSKGGAR